MTDQTKPASEWKPCPFCGKDAATIWNPSDTEWTIECYDGLGGCMAEVAKHTRAEAITAWNTRAPSMPIDERAEFEAWSMSFPHMAEQATRNTEYPDQYEDITMQIEWQAWQARSALGSLK